MYATESKLLALIVACLLERIVRESPVVAMIIINFYAVLSGKGLKGVFGGNGLDG
jgi:hypothetical protein